MSGCVFCNRIGSAEYLDIADDIVWFEPLNPVTPGHMLFVPCIHTADAREYPSLTGRAFARAAAHGFLMAEDFNLITSAGAAATQTIKHLHVHYIPRRPGDGLRLPWSPVVPVGVAGDPVQGVCADEDCTDCYGPTRPTAAEPITMHPRLAPPQECGQPYSHRFHSWGAPARHCQGYGGAVAVSPEPTEEPK